MMMMIVFVCGRSSLKNELNAKWAKIVRSGIMGEQQRRFREPVQVDAVDTSTSVDAGSATEHTHVSRIDHFESLRLTLALTA